MKSTSTDCPRVRAYMSIIYKYVCVKVKVLELRIRYIITSICTRSIQGSGSRYSFLVLVVLRSENRREKTSLYVISFTIFTKLFIKLFYTSIPVPEKYDIVS